ncbi:hypothetical protein [Nocardia sp. NPDC058480]|uniref:hypothetical protein n=1 Tax=Nocardia sp. NPDC058480 TaxID=3346522 RepID=UPI003669CAA4
MAINVTFGQRSYSCDFCFDDATVLDTDHGHFCQRCTDSYGIGSDEFLAKLDDMERRGF